MTQKDLAKILHVSVSTISNYEKDVHLPDVDKLIDIADFFDVTTDYLLSRTDSNMSPSVLQTIVLDGRPIREVLQRMQALSSEQQHALLIALDDMYLAATVARNSHYDAKAKGI
ncbi:MAG: helix-turn-helix domain-containing protein [Oscillospiraceae bacterium]